MAIMEEAVTFVQKENVAELGSELIPTELYYSQEQFKIERERVFSRAWLFAGRDVEIPKPGDFFAKEWDICDANILITRGKDSQIRAFHNVCSHRSVKVVWEDRGSAFGFSCPYHGWRYGLDGAAVSIPDSESFFGLDIKSCGLTPVHVEVWNSLIFINLSAAPEQTLLEFLGPIKTKILEHSLEGFESFVTIGGDVPVNWKCLIDNFQETYHLASVHRLSVADRSVGSENPLAHPISFEFFGLHRLMGVWGNPHRKPDLVEGIAIKGGGVISQGAVQQNDSHKLLRHPNWQLDVHGIFPTLLFDVAPTFFFIHEFFPVTVDQTRWHSTVWFPKAINAAQRFSQEYSVAAFRDTVAEDLAVLRTQQRAIRSGAKKYFNFQLSETMCRHSYMMLNKYIEQSPNQAVD
ncbi:(2Fe-2S)-binding protein [Acidocella aquatica]|uniref:(2Fe-2S)-binding protein n=1 Tax=Acidocella aquatica TaxID=1922313 RepID=A0ABQ6A7C2_9PROT|nr:aromatic ring-hydroxylating dioxygenase subunit alpha [Acidocella aquatica]GLR66014.1 (2Fe-2S)-binding protein [Acidocella aquatica]